MIDILFIESAIVICTSRFHKPKNCFVCFVAQWTVDWLLKELKIPVGIIVQDIEGALLREEGPLTLLIEHVFWKKDYFIVCIIWYRDIFTEKEYLESSL